MKMLRRLATRLPLLLLLLTLGSGAATADSLPEAGATGMRALWIPRWGLADLTWSRKMVDDAVRAGFTDLFVQVDGRGETYYLSQLLPKAEDVAPGIDPLDAILTEAHAHGLRVHAWINAYTIGLPNRKPVSPDHPLNKHPDWITYDNKGQSLLSWAPQAQSNLEGYFMDPSLPEVQAYVVDVVREIVTEYPLDGVHLDYIRYPGRGFGFHPLARAAFKAATGVDPLDLAVPADQGLQEFGAQRWAELNARWDEWRRDQVSGLVRRVGIAARQARPGIAVSVAAFPDLNEAENGILQDWPAWLTTGDVDFVLLMTYSTDTSLVLRQMERARAAVPGGRIYPGLGVYKFKDWTTFAGQLSAIQAAGFGGMAIYSYQSLSDLPGGLDGITQAWGEDGKSILNPPAEAPAQ